ncbi:ATP-binding cassette domain-containing protein [Lysobacter sp. BMK333-48F3]|uniref:ATP-binding cassette domain-containing protein n=1 Tax=Lysobacter sp. BMK333-48F3 TaxID=2867962 RepID=UPI001C8B1201|nr:ATP-binding cassette domain-containing protein [Lysobacter sp. BMK333-48F3]MBX9400862.1 ATP-binding cassette domain-containing protein [Lysobacter sp. BMK333-48F3]
MPAHPASDPVRLQAFGLSAVLDDGRILYQNLDLSLRQGYTALVGRNGAGKSTLLAALAGDAAPAQGRIERRGAIVHLRTDAAPESCGSIAALLGVAPALAALDRLAAGQGNADDLVRVADRWDLRERLARSLDEIGLAGLSLRHDPGRLSGGQRQQLRLLGAWLADADIVLLDEPSRHLDAESSAHWFQRYAASAAAVLAVSHDPAWLEQAPRIVELDREGATEHDGGLAQYLRQRDRRRREGLDALDAARLALRRERRDQVRQREALDRRAARGQRAGAQANQSKLLLDFSQNAAERHQGRRRAALSQRLQQRDAAVSDAYARANNPAAPVFLGSAAQQPAGRRTLEFAAAHPCRAQPARSLSATLDGPVRIGLSGRNGSGKTSLLRAIAGLGTLAAGRARATVPALWLDQDLRLLPAQAGALDWIAGDAARGDAPARAALATRLALLGLPGDRARQAMATLSAGERMRAALAAAAYRDPPAPLLLLDEPGEHLDLDSREALIGLLDAWPGAFVVASHDRHLLEALRLSHRIHLTDVSAQLETIAASSRP